MTDLEPGPLRLPPPPNVEAALAQQKLRGHSTSDRWLPQGLWPELEELRSEQLRLRHQVGTELAALEAARTRFRKQDERHEFALRQAQRDGRPDSVKDRRTPSAKRQAETQGNRGEAVGRGRCARRGRRCGRGPLPPARG